MKRIGFLCLWFGIWILGCGRQETVEEGSLAVPVEEKQEVVAEGNNATVGPPLTNSIGMKLVLIPAEEFQMGSPDADSEAREDEKPQHRVRITQPFHLGVYEVTQGEYEQVTGISRSFFSPTGPGRSKVAGQNTARFPVEQVTWHDAVEFCRRLSELPAEKAARRVYRLPTEAEWEYACRAGTQTAFAFGNSLSSSQANFNGTYPAGGAAPGPFLVRTTEVGSYPPNAFGLYDMHGNVWEWCTDWYGLHYYRESPADDPPGPKSGSMRVIRGGEWYGDARDCRSAFRYADLPTGVFYVMGFRVVMTVSESTKTAPQVTVTPKPSIEAVIIPPPVPRDFAKTSLGEDWPQWRGPRSDGTWRGPQLSEKWPATGLPCLWRQPIGGGYAGIAAVGGRVVTLDYHPPTLTLPPTGGGKKNDLPPKGRGNGGEIERVLCFEAATGKLIWSHPYLVKYDGLSYGNGPRATPTIRDEHVYTLGAVGHLHCLDAATGKLVWSKDLVRDQKARMPGWGFAASPLVFEELLIVHVGAAPNGSVLALDRRTGEEVWRSLPDPAGYATPILAESPGSRQLVCWTPTHVRGVELRTGQLLWTIPFEVTYSTSIATPIFQENIVFVSGYYEGSKAIRLGNDPTEAKVVWEDRRNLRGLMSQPLYRDGHGYLLDKRHGLTCFELKTGKKLWDDSNRMTPKGRNPQATMVWAGAGDRALILNSDGDLILARLNPTGYHEQSRTNIIGPTWAHPAYAGNCVYARNDSELVCVVLPGADLSLERPQRK